MYSEQPAHQVGKLSEEIDAPSQFDHLCVDEVNAWMVPDQREVVPSSRPINH
jgi:hypothetical protein